MKWKALTGLFLFAIAMIVISFNDTTTFADDIVNQPLFTITIPKQLTIDADKCVEYQVCVHRNRTNAGTVTVIPDTEVVLSDSKGKADVTGQVAQDQTQFDFAADGADEQVTNGTVTANDLTAGDWTGSFNFKIDMQETKIGDDITLTSDNLEVYNISTSGDVVIPEYVTDTGGVKHKVTSINEYTFGGCSEVTSITIPKSVTSIGNCVAPDCDKLVSIIVDSENPVYDSRNNSNAIIETETNRLIQGCNTTVIPETVTTIGQYSFSYCNLLATISVPDSVKSIEKRAFDSCENLTSITIPNSVTSIDSDAFEWCSSLTSICIPNSVININDYAFWKCVGLTTVTIPSSVTNIGSSVFSECTGLTDAIIENGVASLSDFMFSGCTNLTQITIPTSVTKIGYSTFANCSNLSNIVIPNGVTSIGNGAFNNCFGFTNITIPENVTSIGYTAFDGCTNLTDVVFKNPNKWYVGSRAGLKDSLVSSSDLAISTKAATYLKKTHCYKYWTQG